MPGVHLGGDDQGRTGAIRISEKLEEFRSGELAAVEVGLPEMTALGIGRDIHIAPALCEEHVSVQSGLVADRGRVFIGSRSYMNSGGYIREGVFVGRYCSIGRRVTLAAGAHHVDGLSTSPSLGAGKGSAAYTEDERTRLGLRALRDRRLTVLMNDVWVGDGAVIMSGVTVGTGAVIGANAVVTQDVPPYAVVGGAAARVLRFRFPQDVVADLLASEWWEHSHEVLRTLPVRNVLSTLEALARLGPPGTEGLATYCLAPSQGG